MCTPESSTRHTEHEKRTVGDLSKPLVDAPTGTAQRDPHRSESNHQQGAHQAPPASEARTEVIDDPFRYQIEVGHVDQPETD
jgi:hypothetical protein